MVVLVPLNVSGLSRFIFVHGEIFVSFGSEMDFFPGRGDDEKFLSRVRRRKRKINFFGHFL
jgi:hypothetical protein